MRKLLLTGLVFAGISSTALAAEPLTNDRLDEVTAGASLVPFLFVAITGSLTSTGGLVANFATASGVVLVP